MSYVVYVKQFLAPEAGHAFDDAYRLHRSLVSTREGFVSLRRLAPTTAGHENEIVLLLEFQTSEHLQAWRSCEEHAAVAGKYRPLWVREPVTEFFAAQE